MTRRLFTVGPVEVRDEVLGSMNRPMIIHRGKEYKRLQEGIVEKIHRVLDTDMHVLLAPASATGFMEACVRSGVSGKVLGASNGSFGKRWQDIAAANGKDVVRVDVEWGKAIRPEDITPSLDDDVEAVTVVSNESSTGVYNPMSDIARAVRDESDALLMVDGVTSVGGIDLRLREMRPDALVFGTQKALALPPGLAVMCVSDEMLERASKVDCRGFYFDILKLKEKADTGYTLTTPPVSLLYGLDYQLDGMISEGMPKRYARHAGMADAVRSWASDRLGLYAEEGHRSNTISVVQKCEMDFDTVYSRLLEAGFEISNGYGSIKSTTFRIGHMGDLTVEDIGDLLNAMDEAMEVNQ